MFLFLHIFNSCISPSWPQCPTVCSYATS